MLCLSNIILHSFEHYKGVLWRLVYNASPFIIAGSGGMRLLQSCVQALTVQPAMLQSSKASPFWERATNGEPAAVATSAAAHMQHAGVGVNPWPPPPVRPR